MCGNEPQNGPACDPHGSLSHSGPTRTLGSSCRAPLSPMLGFSPHLSALLSARLPPWSLLLLGLRPLSKVCPSCSSTSVCPPLGSLRLPGALFGSRLLTPCHFQSPLCQHNPLTHQLQGPVPMLPATAITPLVTTFLGKACGGRGHSRAPTPPPRPPILLCSLSLPWILASMETGLRLLANEKRKRVLPRSESPGEAPEEAPSWGVRNLPPPQNSARSPQPTECPLVSRSASPT